MKLTFRRNTEPTADSPNPEEFEEEQFQAPEATREKTADRREYTATLFLKADTAVKSSDEVMFGERWFSIKKFEPVYRTGASAPSHFEAMI